MADEEQPLTGPELVKEVCRLIRLARVPNVTAATPQELVAVTPWMVCSRPERIRSKQMRI